MSWVEETKIMTWSHVSAASVWHQRAALCKRSRTAVCIFYIAEWEWCMDADNSSSAPLQTLTLDLRYGEDGNLGLNMTWGQSFQGPQLLFSTNKRLRIHLHRTFCRAKAFRGKHTFTGIKRARIRSFTCCPPPPGDLLTQYWQQPSFKANQLKVLCGPLNDLL